MSLPNITDMFVAAFKLLVFVFVVGFAVELSAHILSLTARSVRDAWRKWRS